jgi:hypothetical protein
MAELIFLFVLSVVANVVAIVIVIAVLHWWWKDKV